MTVEKESETALSAQSAILKAVGNGCGTVTVPARAVADAFPGTDRIKRCEMLLYWAETQGLEVKSHKICDPDEMCEEWPCGPIDFEPGA
jgi:hypothetical protein